MNRVRPAHGPNVSARPFLDNIASPMLVVEMSLRITAAVLPPDRLPLHPCHDGMLIAAYSYYANTMVDARRKWTTLVEKFRRLLRFRRALDRLSIDGIQDPNELVDLDPDVL